MRATLKIFAVAVAALAGCGNAATDPSIHHDAGNLDAAGVPPPPMLGAQIGRIGRPAISTLLVGTFAAEPTRTTVKDAYRQASDPTTWKTAMLRANVSIEQEFETNLAVLDALDAGMTSVPMPGCRNALLYSGPPGSTSYQSVADLFADDQLYVDTSKSTCTQFLAFELEYGSGGNLMPHTTCGGRTPTHDVIDAMYSILAAGITGFNLMTSGDPIPLIQDNAPVHTYVKNTFPFLDPPHP